MIKLIVLSALLASNLMLTAAEQQQVEICEDYDLIHYSAIVGPLRRDISDITISALPTTSPVPGRDYGSNKQMSPHGTAAFFLNEADMTKPAPWTSSVFIFGNKARAVGWRLTVRNHGNGGVRATWINDKLLSIQVWPGRILSTDLILDIEKGRFIYADDAVYSFGGATRPGCVNSPSPR